MVPIGPTHILQFDMQVHFCEGGQLVDAGHAHLHIYVIDDTDYKPSTQRRQNKKNNVCTECVILEGNNLFHH